jgi:hypothetical protein
MLQCKNNIFVQEDNKVLHHSLDFNVMYFIVLPKAVIWCEDAVA